MNKRMHLTVWGCVALGATAALAQEATTETEKTTVASREAALKPMRSSRGSNAAVRLLTKRVERVEWTDAPFDDVINWLKDESEGRVNITPHWRALGLENVTRDSLITVQLDDTIVADVLDEVVNQLSEDAEVTFHAEDNKLIISTHAEFGRKMFLKVYEVTDIQFRPPNMGSSAPKIDLQNQQRSGGTGGGGGGGQGVFSGGGGQGSEENVGGQQEEQEIGRRLEDLRQRITRTIAPETWDTGTAGSTGRGRIEVFNTFLIVLNTVEVHEQISSPFVWAE